jgi:nitroreductase
MKSVLSLLLLIVLRCSVLNAQSPGNSVTDVILSGYSVKTFSSEPVTDQQIDLILKCGIKAPSARNSQLWKFTVIKDNAITKDIISNITPGNVLIIVSGAESQQAGVSVDFDCALATQNMYIAVQSLGLGAHIYGSPVGAINTSKRQSLAIPDGYRVVTILRIGNIDKSVDAISAASARKKLEEVINYK